MVSYLVLTTRRDFAATLAADFATALDTADTARICF